MAEKNLDEKLVPLTLLKSPNVNSPEQIVYTEFYNLVKANLRLKSPPVGHESPIDMKNPTSQTSRKDRIINRVSMANCPAVSDNRRYFAIYASLHGIQLPTPTLKMT